MNEPLSEVIRIRVTPSHAARLGEAAALSGLSLSNYVRRRLVADDNLQEELTLLRQILRNILCVVCPNQSRSAQIETQSLI